MREIRPTKRATALGSAGVAGVTAGAGAVLTGVGPGALRRASKAFRWASDRIGEEGIVAFVSNSSFIDSLAFDGVRQHLEQEFDEIYVLDLGGNVRKNPRLSGTTHNVFGIQVGVSINLFARFRTSTTLPQKDRSHSLCSSR